MLSMPIGWASMDPAELHEYLAYIWSMPDPIETAKKWSADVLTHNAHREDDPVDIVWDIVFIALEHGADLSIECPYECCGRISWINTCISGFKEQSFGAIGRLGCLRRLLHMGGRVHLDEGDEFDALWFEFHGVEDESVIVELARWQPKIVDAELREKHWRAMATAVQLSEFKEELMARAWRPGGRVFHMLANGQTV